MHLKKELHVMQTVVYTVQSILMQVQSEDYIHLPQHQYLWVRIKPRLASSTSWKPCI